MKWLNCSKIRLMLVGFVAAIVFGGGNANGDFIFGEPVNLGPTVNSSSCEYGLSVSADGLSLYFDSDRPSMGAYNLYVATRETTDDDWGPPVKLGPNVNSANTEACPSISSDGLELYFSGLDWQGTRTEFGGSDLWVTRRASASGDWSIAENLGPIVNSSAHDVGPCISDDGLKLYFDSGRPGGYSGWDIWVTTRKTKDDPWEEPVNLGPTVNSYEAISPSISADGLALFSWSRRPGGYGQADIWLTRRPTKNGPWGPPVNLGPTINTSAHDLVPYISPDGSSLYFSSGRSPNSGCFDIWEAPIIPIVDLNGDGIVDAEDMCIMVDHWCENYSLCDIGPTPLGDGIVDVEDLKVLAENLFEEVFPIELVAYWKLDEVEGDIAYNSTSDNHGILSGNPTWQPDSGQVAGALELDGIDNYASTDFVLNPADGPFSVFAWIKGGAPGQVIISQADGTGTGETWLGMDALGGKLMTGLRPPGGRSPTPPMVSDFVITEGQWHHVGIVVTAYGVRNLYADGIRVAADTQGVNLPSSNGGLYFGTSKTLEAGTFFSGLIDDVRIYDVALTAEEIAALAD